MRWKKLLLLTTMPILFLCIISIVEARTYTLPDRPNGFPSKSGSFITFDRSLLPMNLTTLYKDSSARWHFNSYYLTSTIDMTIKVFFSNNWFNYTVNGLGTQQVYEGSKPNAVFIDGTSKFENDGWSYGSGTVTVTGASSSVAMYWGSAPPPPPVPTLPPYTPPSVLLPLAQGDFLGFFVALYVAAFGSIDLWLGAVGLIVTMSIYFRTKSLSLLSIMWILVGTVLITALPFVAGLGVFFVIIGVAVMLFGLLARRGEYS